MIKNFEPLIAEISKRNAYDELLDFLPKLKDYSQEEQEQMCQDLLQKVCEKYPLPSKPELMKAWNATHDWDDMKRRLRLYWTSVDDLLKDAIAARQLDIVAYLAPMYVNHPDKASFFPNGVIQAEVLPLFDAGLKPLSYYSALPFCVKIEKFDSQEKQTLIAYNEEARQNCAKAFIRYYAKQFQVDEKGLTHILQDGNEEKFAFDANGLWLGVENERFICLPYGQFTDDMQWMKDTVYNAAISDFRVSGWDLHVDGVMTVFGEITYNYITSTTADHPGKEGNVWHNGVLQEEE